MKSTLAVVLLASYLLSAQGAPAKTCYWDSDCSHTAAQCCIGMRCRSSNSCAALRDYPLPNFQACFSHGDCVSGCCHNNYCSWEDTCNASSAAMPLVVFLVAVGMLTVGLLGVLVRDILTRKRRQALEGYQERRGSSFSQQRSAVAQKTQSQVVRPSPSGI